MEKYPVAILGATGLVGKQLVKLLQDHPWFELKKICASKQSVGQLFQSCLTESEYSQYNRSTLEHTIEACFFDDEEILVFSALNSEVATEIETFHLKNGRHVISNAKNFREHENVPIILPEVNAHHLSLIDSQPYKGKMITNPNCVVAGLALALHPLEAEYGLESMHLVSFQALSGGGTKLMENPDYHNNIVPYIPGEREKIEREPLKILGELCSSSIQPLDCQISAQCLRSPLQQGHYVSLSVKLKQITSPEEVANTLKNYYSPFDVDLPSYQPPLQVFEDFYRPQPKLDLNVNKGMSVSIGNISPCSCLDIKLNLLVDNLMRGAAGAALLNGELFYQTRLKQEPAFS